MTENVTITVTHADMRALGYCNRGARAWFERHHFDWSAFIEQGIAASKLLMTGDSMAEEVVAVARRRMGGDIADGR